MRAALVCLLALAGCGGRARAHDDAGAAAERVVSALLDGRWSEVAAALTPALRAELPPAGVARLWGEASLHAGPLRARLPLRASALPGGARLWLVPLDFEYRYLTVRVEVDARGRVEGLRTVAGLPEAEVPRLPRGVREEEVRVGDLPGTLTWPPPAGDSRVPAVVLLHGSGAQDRDGTVGPNRVFADLAWGLAALGVAVLRYDKRSFRGEAGSLADDVGDAAAAVARVAREARVDPARVFVLGHSLGGVLAPRVAQAAPVAGVIAAAAPARPLEDALLEQAEYVARWRPGGEPELARLRGKIARVRAGDLTGDMPLGLPVAFWRDLRDHPLAGELARTSALPFLIVQGGRDYQATAADLAAWRELLRGRPADIREYPALDHLLMRGEGMATPKSYGVPGRVDRRLIDDVAGWILTH